MYLDLSRMTNFLHQSNKTRFDFYLQKEEFCVSIKLNFSKTVLVDKLLYLRIMM